MLLVLQLAIGAVLLFASLGKWRNPMSFVRGVDDYDLLPGWLARIFALVLVPLETCVAASHLTGWWISMAVPLGLIMFSSFTIAVAINLARGRSLPCYCFGNAGGETISVQALSRLLLLLGGEALLLFAPGQRGGARLVYQQLATWREFGFALFWTAFLMVLAMWLLGLKDVLDLRRHHFPDGASGPGEGPAPA